MGTSGLVRTWVALRRNRTLGLDLKELTLGLATILHSGGIGRKVVTWGLGGLWNGDLGTWGLGDLGTWGLGDLGVLASNFL